MYIVEVMYKYVFIPIMESHQHIWCHRWAQRPANSVRGGAGCRAVEVHRAAAKGSWKIAVESRQGRWQQRTPWEVGICRNSLNTSEQIWTNHVFCSSSLFFHFFCWFFQLLIVFSPFFLVFSLRPHSPAEAAERWLVGGGPLAPHRRGRRGARRRRRRGGVEGAAGLGALRSEGEGPTRVAQWWYGRGLI